MKLSDRGFRKFEAAMFVGAMMCVCTIWLAGVWPPTVTSAAVAVLVYVAAAVPAWLSWRGGSWLKLAGWSYLYTVAAAAAVLFAVVYDWSPSAAVRPPDVSPDEGKYFTTNETVRLFLLGWAAFSVVPALAAGWLACRFVWPFANAPLGRK